MNAKQYLKQAYKLNEKIKDKQERLDDLKEMSTSTGAIDYSKDKIQSSPSQDAPFTRQVMQIIELEEELQKDIDRLKNLKVEINRAVESVDDVDGSIVLSKRYILMKTWEQISDEMGYSVSQLHRIHDKAIKIFVVPCKLK